MLKELISIYEEIAVTTPTGGMTHQEVNFGQLLEPKLRKLFYETYDEMPEQFSNVFKVNTSKKAVEVDYALGAMPQWNEFGSAATYTGNTVGGTPVANGTNMPSVNYVGINAGDQRTYIHKEFAQGFMVERKFADDEQYNVIEKMPKDLARAGRYKVESDAASIFNNGFATNGYDGVPLFSGSHPLKGYRDSAGAVQKPAATTSNLITGALSDVNLKLATNMIRRTVDDANKQVQYAPNTLIVPPELEWLAIELTKSARKAGTADNDINSLMGRFKIVVWDFLSDTDSWFVADSKRTQFNFFWRVKPEFKRDEDFDSLVAKYRGYMRYSCGYSDFRGIVGSQG